MNERPTRESDTEEINKDQIIQNLEDEVVQKQLEIEELSEKNMETQVALQTEISQLKKKLKESKADDGSNRQSTRQKQLSERKLAELNVEHEMLLKQVNQMKEFLQENQQKGTNEMEESLTYTSAK